MAVTCILLFLLVSSTSVSGWLTWYASTHHDPNTTPGASENNEVGRQTDSTRIIPGMFPVTCPLVVVSAVGGQCANSPASP